MWDFTISVCMDELMASTLHARDASKSGRKAASRSAQSKAVPPDEDRGAYFSRSVGKAFLILGVLSRTKNALTLMEIAQAAGLTKSSCFRLLFTLQSLGYILATTDGRFGIIADNWINFGTQITNALLGVAAPAVDRLNSEFQETISLAVLFSNHIEVVQVKESPQVIRMANTVGRILPPHASSLGKAITAFQSAEVSDNLLRSYGLTHFTASSITDEALVKQELEEIRKSGVAREAEESTPDGCCFGCPIFLEGDFAVAAISISMPKSRLPKASKSAHMCDTLKQESRTISQKLREVMKIPKR